jgi:hypothetical protein
MATQTIEMPHHIEVDAYAQEIRASDLIERCPTLTSWQSKRSLVRWSFNRMKSPPLLSTSRWWVRANTGRDMVESNAMERHAVRAV